MRRKRIIQAGALLVAMAGVSGPGLPRAPSEPGAAVENLFPVPPGLEPRVDFWLAIYTRYSSRQAILHDADFPEVIYGILELGGVSGGAFTELPEEDRARMDEARDRVAAVLAQLAHFRGDPAELTPEERQIWDAAAHLPGRKLLGPAAERVRSQVGQADNFRDGLARSGRYLEAFRRIAAEEGVPGELVYLPHVESSFQVLARSSAGAAGMWQFMPGTARLFLEIDGSRDERLDPWMSARAAFRLLRGSQEALGSWPLAITAYNHGQAGMARARRRHGDDLVTIIDKYNARSFGFASKNFYAEFMAVLRIVGRPRTWFGPLQPDAPVLFERFDLPDFTLLPELAAALRLDLDDLRPLNPALRSAVWTGRQLAPRGYELRVPEGYARRLRLSWKDLPGSFRYESDVETAWHVVRKGENLSIIARRYGISVSRLISLNRMGRRRTIYPDQRLKIRQTEHWTPIPGAGVRRHVVRKGETLEEIGRRYGISVTELARTNGLLDPSRVLAGQVLVIPGTPTAR